MVLGILFSLATVSISGLAPVYRVRSASRSLASTIEEVRALAIARGLPMGIRYNLTDPASYQIIPPAPDDFPDEPIEMRKLESLRELPTGVRIKRLTFPGAGSADGGSLDVIFSPMGNSGSHIVTFEGASQKGEPLTISVKFNAITGTIDFVTGEAVFQEDRR
jgi:hypothetical protein